MVLDVALVGHAGHLRDDLAEHHVAAVAVLGPRAGRECERLRCDEQVVVVVGLEPGLVGRREGLAEEIGDADAEVQQLIDGRRFRIGIRIVRSTAPIVSVSFSLPALISWPMAVLVNALPIEA